MSDTVEIENTATADPQPDQATAGTPADEQKAPTEAGAQGKPRNKLLSDSPEKTLTALMEIMESLKVIYADEQNAAKALDIETFMKLQERKQILAHKYQQYFFALSASKDPIENLDDALKEKLRKTHGEFTRLSEENLKILASMKLATGQLRHRILDMAKRHLIKEQNAGYASNGESNGSEKRKISSALNETA